MNCSTTRRVIDEVDNPANLPYEAAGHLEGCVPCGQFAGERERLRKLLLEPARVSAPANFEAMVARRLAGRATRKRSFWLSTGFYLRAGAAAAALACMTLVIQMAWLGRTTSISRMAPPNVASNNDQKAPSLQAGKDASNRATTASQPKQVGPRRTVPVKYVPDVIAKETVADMTAQPRALILVRNSGSEREIAVPMVSVGAQPWFSVSFQSQDQRAIRSAF